MRLPLCTFASIFLLGLAGPAFADQPQLDLSRQIFGAGAGISVSLDSQPRWLGSVPLPSGSESTPLEAVSAPVIAARLSTATLGFLPRAAQATLDATRPGDPTFLDRLALFPAYGDGDSTSDAISWFDARRLQLGLLGLGFAGVFAVRPTPPRRRRRRRHTYPGYAR